MSNRKQAQDDWDVYRRLAPVAVPARAEQMATLLTLIPHAPDAEFTLVELACGEGYLSAAAAELFTNARIAALDGSTEMLERASRRLAKFGERVSVAEFDLARHDWLARFEGAGAVLSSIAIHHLDDHAKGRLYRAIAAILSEPGALLVADIVDPEHPRGRRLFEDGWDLSARTQSLAGTNATALFDLFLSEEWNYFRHPDPFDKPGPLYRQLQMMDEAGLVGVDCFWAGAGHAIYGGFKSLAADERRVALEDALSCAQRSLAEGSSA